MRILPHDKAAEYRRLAEEARAMAKQVSIQDARDKLLATARQFETLADIEDRGLRRTAPSKASNRRAVPRTRMLLFRRVNGSAFSSTLMMATVSSLMKSGWRWPIWRQPKKQHAERSWTWRMMVSSVATGASSASMSGGRLEMWCSTQH
nr:hypothetical protein [Microvirga pakistanensis]